MTEREKTMIKFDIVARADAMEIMERDRMTLVLDLDCADKQFNLRLNDLLNADDFDFAHDICGIQSNINRETKKIENFFVPRFAE